MKKWTTFQENDGLWGVFYLPSESRKPVREWVLFATKKTRREARDLISLMKAQHELCMAQIDFYKREARKT